MSITKRTRYEVLRRDNHTCRYCGSDAADAPLTIDHVTPVALGGTDDVTNLVAACRDCNAGKTSTDPGAPLVAEVADQAVQWAAAVAVAASAALRKMQTDQAAAEPFREAWLDIVGRPGLPATWRASVERWLSCGLPIEMLVNNIEMAYAKPHVKIAGLFAYVAGISWNQVRVIQDGAAEAIGGAESKASCGSCEGCRGMQNCTCGLADGECDNQCSAFDQGSECEWCEFPVTPESRHDRCCAVVVKLYAARVDGYECGLKSGSDRARASAVLARSCDIWAVQE